MQSSADAAFVSLSNGNSVESTSAANAAALARRVYSTNFKSRLSRFEQNAGTINSVGENGEPYQAPRKLAPPPPATVAEPKKRKSTDKITTKPSDKIISPRNAKGNGNVYVHRSCSAPSTLIFRFLDPPLPPLLLLQEHLLLLPKHKSRNMLTLVRCPRARCFSALVQF